MAINLARAISVLAIVFHTTSGGAASIAPWKPASALPGAGIDKVAFNAANPSIGLLGAEGGKVFRTTDGGTTWSPSQVGSASEYFRAIGFDPVSGSTVYAFSTNNAYSFKKKQPVNDVYVSSDGGVTWAKTATAPVAADGYSAFEGRGVVVGSTAGSAVIADGFAGIFWTADGGATWKNSLPQPAKPYSLVRDPSNPTTLWASGYIDNNGTYTSYLWQSKDFGQSWTPHVITGLPSGAEGYGVAIQPGSGRIFVGYTTINPGAQGGIAVTADGGTTWALSNNGLLSDFLPGNSNGWMVFDPVSPNRIYLGVNGGLGPYISTDGGAHWQYEPTKVSGAFTIALRPAAGSLPAALFAGLEDLFVSVERGKTFTLSDTGLSGGWAYVLANDWLSAGGLYACAINGDLFHTSNGGTSWQRIDTWHGSRRCLLASSDPVGSTHALYVLTYDMPLRIWRTTDVGKTWTDVTPSGEQTGLYPVVADPTVSGVVYGVGVDTFYHTSDGGSSWMTSPIGNANDGFYALTVAAQPSGTLYAALTSGVWKSSDFGATWALLPNQPSPGQSVVSVTVQQATPYAVFASVAGGSAGPAVLESMDGGTTWQAAAGYGTAGAHQYALLNVPGSDAIASTDLFGSNYACGLSKDSGATVVNVCGALKAVSTGNATALLPTLNSLFFADEDGALYEAPYGKLK